MTGSRWFFGYRDRCLGFPLIILFVTVVASVILTNTAEIMKDKIDITIYFKPNTSEEVLADLTERIEQDSNIKSVETSTSKEEYQKLWIGRCDRSYDLLLQTTENDRKMMQEKAPELFLYGAEEDLSELYFEDSFGMLYVYRDGKLSTEE